MKKHTPGPWRLGTPGCVVCDAMIGLPSYDLGSVAHYGGHLICESIAAPHDAYLISAAPELLAVLKELQYLATKKLFHAARAAIAQAEGRGVTP